MPIRLIFRTVSTEKQEEMLIHKIQGLSGAEHAYKKEKRKKPQRRRFSIGSALANFKKA